VRTDYVIGIRFLVCQIETATRSALFAGRCLACNRRS
jgi:hypothetical protein